MVHSAKTHYVFSFASACLYDNLIILFLFVQMHYLAIARKLNSPRCPEEARVIPSMSDNELKNQNTQKFCKLTSIVYNVVNSLEIW